MVGDWFTESLALVNVLVVGAGLGRGEERKEGCGTDRLYQNVGVNYQYTLRNVPGERSTHVYSDGRGGFRGIHCGLIRMSYKDERDGLQKKCKEKAKTLLSIV